MKRHADIELGHSTYTDNDGLQSKILLRKAAIKGLAEVKVLELFAGDNLIWSNISCSRYYGIEAEKGKGKTFTLTTERPFLFWICLVLRSLIAMHTECRMNKYNCCSTIQRLKAVP